ncbi:PaaI family thioesterase [Aspergillus stella-maris]|uniref:PaaI family thioesterase n=1 Tax=Aspergillus stella-maris TaxID=1810926 RepID=UPI003CCE21A5
MPPPTLPQHQIPGIFLSTPLTKYLLSQEDADKDKNKQPPYKIHTTAATSSKIPNPFFNITARSPPIPPSPINPNPTSQPAPPAILLTLFLSRPLPKPSAHLLLHVGTGVTGQNAIAHGGFLATCLDEVCGNLISAEGVDGGLGMFTVQLDVKYQAPVFIDEGAGSVIVASAEVERVEGRKVFVEACVRDKDGVICTRGEAVFVKKKGQAAL